MEQYFPIPSEGQVLCEPLAIEMESQSGIVQAGVGLKGFSHSMVLACGEGVTRVKPGDVAYYRSSIAQPVRVPDGILDVVDQVHIYAKLSDGVAIGKVVSSALDSGGKIIAPPPGLSVGRDN